MNRIIDQYLYYAIFHKYFRLLKYFYAIEGFWSGKAGMIYKIKITGTFYILTLFYV